MLTCTYAYNVATPRERIEASVFLTLLTLFTPRETFRYQREILDMASRHAHERDVLRRKHLERVTAITGGGE
jgi:hypothetical protein